MVTLRYHAVQAHFLSAKCSEYQPSEFLSVLEQKNFHTIILTPRNIIFSIRLVALYIYVYTSNSGLLQLAPPWENHSTSLPPKLYCWFHWPAITLVVPFHPAIQSQKLHLVSFGLQNPKRTCSWQCKVLSRSQPFNHDHSPYLEIFQLSYPCPTPNGSLLVPFS